VTISNRVAQVDPIPPEIDNDALAHWLAIPAIPAGVPTNASVMKIAALVARLLLGLIFVVLGLNGFFNSTGCSELFPWKG